MEQVHPFKQSSNSAADMQSSVPHTKAWQQLSMPHQLHVQGGASTAQQAGKTAHLQEQAGPSRQARRQAAARTAKASARQASALAAAARERKVLSQVRQLARLFWSVTAGRQTDQAPQACVLLVSSCCQISRLDSSCEHAGSWWCNMVYVTCSRA